jgi:hypothetical protein
MREIGLGPSQDLLRKSAEEFSLEPRRIVVRYRRNALEEK